MSAQDNQLYEFGRGRKVAFVSPSTEMIAQAYWLQVYVVDADGSNLKMITRSPHSIFYPSGRLWGEDNVCCGVSRSKGEHL
jgi:hypothetical protein